MRKDAHQGEQDSRREVRQGQGRSRAKWHALAEGSSGGGTGEDDMWNCKRRPAAGTIAGTTANTTGRDCQRKPGRLTEAEKQVAEVRAAREGQGD